MTSPRLDTNHEGVMRISSASLQHLISISSASHQSLFSISSEPHQSLISISSASHQSLIESTGDQSAGGLQRDLPSVLDAERLEVVADPALDLIAALGGL